MRHRNLATRTNSARVVRGGRLEIQYLVGSVAPVGHSAISQRVGRSWPGWARWCAGLAGRTRRNTNRELIIAGFPARERDPSRQVIRRAARDPTARTRSLTEDAACW